ncbi:hypothetical protein SDC9_189043 [bioreactor metagenome]|uniref:Uncharacterized protein n=1 Tax=bioreactor metagenome TaxID=1076179 RepID=A0A645HRB8_9ZZZZ
MRAVSRFLGFSNGCPIRSHALLIKSHVIMGLSMPKAAFSPFPAMKFVTMPASAARQTIKKPSLFPKSSMMYPNTAPNAATTAAMPSGLLVRGTLTVIIPIIATAKFAARHNAHQTVPETDIRVGAFETGGGAPPLCVSAEAKTG